MKLVKDIHAQNGEQFSGFDLQVGWSLQQGSILFFLSLDGPFCGDIYRMLSLVYPKRAVSFLYSCVFISSGLPGVLT